MTNFVVVISVWESIVCGQILNPYEFGSHFAATVPGSEDFHLHCGWLRDSS